MLTIRLTRKGKKNQPFFRVVLVDKRRSSTGGRAVEDLGYVDPIAKRKAINKERVQYWISKGAQPSDTIHNLLVAEKIIEGKKVAVAKLSKKKQAEIKAAAEEAAKKAAAEKAAKEAAEAQAKADAEAAKAAAEAKPAASAESSGEPKEEPKAE